MRNTVGGHTPRKRFGQNFLHDPTVITRIVNAVAPRAGDRIVEVGPGLGALTAPLLAAAGELDVVELDRDVIPLLEANCAGRGILRVHHSDVLKFDLARLAQGGRKLRIVGNLPYNISTPLLFHLLDSAEWITDMHVMVQKEVAQRMAAGAGDEAYGRLSVMMAYLCRVDLLFQVGPGAFRPAPKVESAVVRMTPHAHPPVEVNDRGRLSEIVARAFSMRRKTLRNSLRDLLDETAIRRAGIAPEKRPEELSLADFARLANANANRPEASA